MIPFCGRDECQIDANGRVKLSPRVLEDFRRGGSDVVLRCLPEGGIGVYPEEAFLEMRRNESSSATQAGMSALARRRMRLFNAMSQSARISEQGRITLPEFFRQHGCLEKNSMLVIAGVEIGVEIWSLDRWNAEMSETNEHENEKSRLEMASELASLGASKTGDGKNE